MIFKTSICISLRILFILFLCSFQVLIFAQAGYKIEGLVKNAGKPLAQADVIITNSAGVEKALITNSSGVFNYNLPPNDEFNITITKIGFTQFQIIYSTMGMTAEIAKKFTSPAKIESELFELPTDQASILKLEAILDKPLLSFYYNSEKNSVDSDDDLNQSLTQNMASVAKLSGTQSSLTETTYKNAIAKGDAALQAKTFDVAQSAYKEASASKPNEQYPKSKLAEIDKLIADADAKSKAAALEKERFAKEKELAAAAAKEKAEKEKALADATAKEKAEKVKAIAAAAEADRLAKEKEKADALDNS